MKEMVISREVKGFFDRLLEHNVPSGLVSLVMGNIDDINKGVIDAVLRHRVSFEESWSSYKLTDVDIFYDEDMLQFSDRLEMFGIRDLCPPVRSTDTTLTMVYRFNTYDAWGNDLDMVTGFGIIIKPEVNEVKSRNIIMYG